MKRSTGYWLLLGGALLIGAGIAAYELIASPLQAMLLADYAKRLVFRSEAGSSDQIRFPEAGPHDERMGYTRIPAFTRRVKEQGFVVARQARISEEMAQLADWGLFLPYREKSGSGLSLKDCNGSAYYSFRYPARAYRDFTTIPPVVANTLLFIENRELLDPNHPRRNPAIEWDRFAQALLDKLVQVVQPGRNVPGGSTLATQIEKYRHSADGLTMTAGDKLGQMASASLRAYLDGTDTMVTRRRIVLDYLNTVPLAAVPGFGEVNGLGDGLAAWFGLDFEAVNRQLVDPRPEVEVARAYKHVLALLISQRKPSWYLVSGRRELDALVKSHLGLLVEAKVITRPFADLVARQTLEFRKPLLRPEEHAFARRKAAIAARYELMGLLGVPRLYDLDRLDLSVGTTLHAPTQEAVADTLLGLKDPENVKAAGMYGDYLLHAGNDLEKVIYGFTLYELTESGALLRVQADSLNQPFDINQGAKLDMGSSAKLRTLITYLQLIADLHGRYAKQSAAQLAQIKIPEKDVLTRWAVNYLRQATDRDLATMLRAAMGRAYSADTSEGFFTGGGVHHFANFRREDDGRVMDLWEATRQSVNLPFIRLMRDIVRHFMYRAPGTAARILEDAEDPRRRSYLLKFADHEGKTFLARFWKKYRGLSPVQATDALLNHLSAHPRRLAAVYRYLEPRSDLAAFRTFMEARLANPERFDDDDFQRSYEDYGPERYNLADRAYIAQLHPLELWLVAHLRRHPKATWDEVVQASAQARVDGYEWLFKTSRKNAQDIRILSLLEIEAFQEIHALWQKLGYPFPSMVPSYASAIGSSADRPAALAELMGIILNDGEKQEPVTIRSLEMASDTPYHTLYRRQRPAAERLFPAEVAQVVRQALVNVVREGTARRVDGAFASSLGNLQVGGKTGTGDHRYDTYSPSGTLLESKVVNRVATFAFFIGHRFYGVVTAFVPGEAAGRYRFTSGLPVQLLKSLAPKLLPLLVGGEAGQPRWEEAAAAFDAQHPPPPGPAVASPTPAPTQTPPRPAAERKPAAQPSPSPSPSPAAETPPREEVPPPPARPPESTPTPIPLPAQDRRPDLWAPIPGTGFNLLGR